MRSPPHSGWFAASSRDNDVSNCVAFVTVQNDYAQAVNIRQGFVAFRRCRRRESLPKPSYRARHGPSQVSALRSALATNPAKAGRPTVPKRCCCPSWPRTTPATISPRRVEMRGFPSLARDVRDDVREKWKIFPNRRSGGEERLSFPSLKPFPLQFGNFLNQFLHQAIVVTAWRTRCCQALGHRSGEASRLALHEVQDLCSAPRRNGIGLAARAGTLRESAAEEPLTRGELRIRERKLRSVAESFVRFRGAHVLYILHIQDQEKVKSKYTMRICSLREHRLKHEWNQMVWSVNNLRADRWRQGVYSTLALPGRKGRKHIGRAI